jgi:1-deoxy-D-xylulose-5-phosphate reductoisomerase
MKKLSIMGSTGSIGTQALEVVDTQDDIKVVALSANSNVELLSNQVRKYKPLAVCIGDKSKYGLLKQEIADTDTKIYAGEEYLSEISSHSEADMVLTSVVGNVGLSPTVDAINNGKNILLANKETLVTGGEFIIPLAKEKKVDVIPVDSEHCAIFQCLKSGEHSEVYKILLTCSGGPFYGKKNEELSLVKPSDALKHPNWNMGSKITIDSATLMNKGLEVIEAKWLFGVECEDIEVYIHRQSIVHSMVEFVDGSVIAQLGVPDMKLPIQYAINYPNRFSRVGERLNLYEKNTLTFDKPDTKTFKCLKLAFDAINEGGIVPCLMNAANEVAVGAFLDGKIGFLDIAKVIEHTMYSRENEPATLKSVLDADLFARKESMEYIERM